MYFAGCIIRLQLERHARALAKSFLVLGGAIISAAMIVRINPVGPRFDSLMIEVWAVLLVIGAIGFLSFPQFVEWRRNHWFFCSADEPVIWQDQFADTDEEAPLILVAASDVFMRSVLDFHFTRAGFRVEHAGSCEEAVSKMKAQPAAILLDLRMPNGNAFYCLRDVRYASRSSKIVALTRRSHPNDQILCRKLGASDSMQKPFDPNDAVIRIARVLNDETVEKIPTPLSA
jgi:CheY-like chemotaxis protein